MYVVYRYSRCPSSHNNPTDLNHHLLKCHVTDNPAKFQQHRIRFPCLFFLYFTLYQPCIHLSTTMLNDILKRTDLSPPPFHTHPNAIA
jgi:hypothetical protein